MANKALKKVVITVLVLAAVCGAVWGGLVLYRNAQKKPVNVYAVSDFAQTEYWGDTSESYGFVTTDKLQNVMISDTQQVREIYVEVGQRVSIGDPLLSYDTTLSDIDLEKARINLSKLELDLADAEKALTELQNMRPHSSVLITPPSTGVQYVPQNTPMLIKGSGTEEDPFYYLWGESDAFTLGALSSMFPKESAEPSDPPEPSDPSEPGTPAEPDTPSGPYEPAEPSDPPEPTEPAEPVNPSAPETAAPVNPNESYVVFLVRQNNALNAPITNYWGLYLNRSSGEVTFRFFEPALPEDIQDFEVEPEPYYQESGSSYTAAELAEMRTAKEQEIADLKLAIRMAEVDLEKLEQEVSDGVVRSKIDGIVKEVRDPDEAYQLSEAVVEVSGGGGYYIDVAMSEMDLDAIALGQTVTVNAWESGGTYEGEIVEISEYPTDSADAWSNGNTNVSYYPFRVFVDESAALKEFEYVSVSYQHTADGESGLYLSNEFIRTEGGKSYVYLRNADGKLEQRTVQTGRSLWGSYTQIRGGLTLEDYIAFPYGPDVADGAETVESTVDAFYGYY